MLQRPNVRKEWFPILSFCVSQRDSFFTRLCLSERDSLDSLLRLVLATEDLDVFKLVSSLLEADKPTSDCLWLAVTWIANKMHFRSTLNIKLFL